jgi:hypothetical protein
MQHYYAIAEWGRDGVWFIMPSPGGAGYLFADSAEQIVEQAQNWLATAATHGGELPRSIFEAAIGVGGVNMPTAAPSTILARSLGKLVPEDLFKQFVPWSGTASDEPMEQAKQPSTTRPQIDGKHLFGRGPVAPAAWVPLVGTRVAAFVAYSSE